MSSKKRSHEDAADPASKRPKVILDVRDDEDPTQHFYEPRSFCDLLLRVNGHVFHCHQMRLAEFSGYFSHFFECSNKGEMLVWPPVDQDAVTSLDPTEGGIISNPFHQNIPWQAIKSILEHIYNPVAWLQKSVGSSSVDFAHSEYVAAGYFEMPKTFCDEIWNKLKKTLNEEFKRHIARDLDVRLPNAHCCTAFAWRVLEKSSAAEPNDRHSLRRLAIHYICMIGVRHWKNAPTKYITPAIWSLIHEQVDVTYEKHMNSLYMGLVQSPKIACKYLDTI